MVLIRIDPTKILVGGDKKTAETFIGPAKSQLNILKNQMDFQKLSQGVRRVWLNENVYVECKKIFNYQECKIWVRPIEIELFEKELLPTIILIISVPSEGRAFAWDLLNNKLLSTDLKTSDTFSVETLNYFVDKIDENDYSPLIQLTYSGEWEKDYLGYDISGVTQEDNLPDPIYGYPWAISSPTNGGSNNYDIIAFNPNSNEWNYDEYYEQKKLDDSIVANTYYFWIPANSFSMINNDNKWEPGDFIRFSTIAGSEEVTIIEKNSLGDFDSSGIVSSVLGSITETWTAVVIDMPAGYFNVLNIHIYGDTVGPVIDSSGGNWSQALKAGLNTNNVLQYYPWIEDPSNIKIKYIELPDEYEDDSYAAYFYSCADGYKKEIWENIFNSMTGYVWPQWYGDDLDYVIRNLLFYNPLFGKSFADQSPHTSRLKASTNDLYDAWNDGDWSESGIIESSSGEFLEYPDYEYNRYGQWTTIGVGKTYEELEEDTTKQLAWVAFDSACFCAEPENYVAPEENEPNDLKTYFYVHYRMKDFLSGYAKSYFDLVNEERESAGLTPLVQNHILYAAALRMASALVASGFNESDPHVGPDGSTVEDRVNDAGYLLNINKLRVVYGENLLRTYMPTYSVADGVASWMDSTGHRENILNETYTETGLAVVKGDGEYYVVCQVFGGKDDVWPGFASMDTTDLTSYINKFLMLSDIDENGDFLKVYVTQKNNS